MFPQNEQKVLVAVSGGADSVALLYGLLELTGLELYVCHVNHNLRGAAAEDATFVQNMCNALNVPCFVYSVQVVQNGQSLEEAARNVRYSCLKKCAKQHNISTIALGHNQNDNAETLLLRLSRGTGLKGLCGIPPIRQENDFVFVRPLIETSRHDIKTFLHDKNIPYCTDYSNYDTKFSRNAVRHKIMPHLAQINTQAIANISNTAQLLTEDEQLLEFFTVQALAECRKNAANAENLLNIESLQKYPVAMQKRIIRQFLTELSPKTANVSSLQNVSQQHVAQILALLKTETGKETHLPKNVIIRREYNFLAFLTKKNKPTENFSVDIPKNEPIFIPILGHYLVASTQMAKLNFTKNFACLCTKRFNYDKIKGTLQIRTRKPGDHINIYKVGTKKLKDEFCDCKIPKECRNSVPLLAMGNEILWIIDDCTANFDQNAENAAIGGRTNAAYIPTDGCTILTVAILRRF